MKRITIKPNKEKGIEFIRNPFNNYMKIYDELEVNSDHHWLQLAAMGDIIILNNNKES